MQQNKTTLVQLPLTTLGNEVGLFYNAPEPTRGRLLQVSQLGQLSLSSFLGR